MVAGPTVLLTLMRSGMQPQWVQAWRAEPRRLRRFAGTCACSRILSICFGAIESGVAMHDSANPRMVASSTAPARYNPSAALWIAAERNGLNQPSMRPPLLMSPPRKVGTRIPHVPCHRVAPVVRETADK
jgi:hypothetical protein